MSQALLSDDSPGLENAHLPAPLQPLNFNHGRKENRLPHPQRMVPEQPGVLSVRIFRMGSADFYPDVSIVP